jgi:hypothetical protein
VGATTTVLVLMLLAAASAPATRTSVSAADAAATAAYLQAVYTCQQARLSDVASARGGVLVYGGFSSPPSEVAVDGAHGRTLSQESLEGTAVAEDEECEAAREVEPGEAEAELEGLGEASVVSPEG